jgi:hypothetical protein
MAPPSATGVDKETPSPVFKSQEIDQKADETATNLMKLAFPSPPKFDDPYKEREYLKGRLILAYRIFAKLGFDEGVAGHITLRVSCSVFESGVVLEANICIGSRRANLILGQPFRRCLASPQIV